MRILVIEDDKSLSDLLKEALAQEGYAVDMAGTGEEGEYLAETIPFDVIVLDIILPGKDGIAVCKSLRAKNVNTPILMLTCKTEESDVIRGLDSGADDYLGKPFHVAILYARLRALVRRRQNTSNPKVEIGNLVIDTVRRQVWQGTQEINLTVKEYDILEFLACNPNTVITRTDLEQHIWNMNMDTSTNLIDVHIKNLRAKLGRENQDLIQTIRGRGYRILLSNSFSG